MANDLLHSVESKLDQLIVRCKQLEQDNRVLKQQQVSWQDERSKLIEKNNLARTRVEAMIDRLKGLESEA